MPINNPSGNPTRQFFQQCSLSNATIDQIGARVDGAGEYAMIKVMLPDDFVTITEFEIVFMPLATEASMYFDIFTYYAGIDTAEDWDAHTESELSRDIGATTQDQNYCHSITDLLDVSALAPRDLVSVRILYDAGPPASNAYVRGIHVKY